MNEGASMSGSRVDAGQSPRPALKRARRSSDCLDDSDSDDHRGQPAEPASSWVENTMPDGPQSFEETFGWCDYILGQLEHKFKSLPLPCKSRNLHIMLTSSYSGMGMSEIAACVLQSVMFELGYRVDLQTHSQCDNDEACLSLARANHVFRDLTERVDDDLWASLCKLQEKHCQRLSETLAGTPKQAMRAATAAAGDGFLQEACLLLDNNLDKFRLTAECHECGWGATCAWAPPQKAGSLWVEAAGNTCTPFSSRGKLTGFLDAQSLPAFVWAFSLKAASAAGRRLDVVLNECVPGFPAEAFFRAVWPQAQIFSMVFSPTELGLPVNRQRRYTLVLPNPTSPLYGKIPFNPSFFRSVAFRRLQLKGSVYLQAPTNLVNDFIDGLAEIKNLPPCPEGHHHGFQAVMATGKRMRMLSHLDVVRERMGDLDANADIAQTPSFSRAMLVVPTFMRNSVIYNFAAGREFLTLELLSAQGVPYFLPDDNPFVREMPHDFLNELAQIPSKKLRSICGNSMNMAQVGSVMAMIFMFATRVELHS